MAGHRFSPQNIYKNFKTLSQESLYKSIYYSSLKGKNSRFCKGWSLYCQYWGLF